MPTSKQGWCKRIVQTLLTLLFIINVNAQAESLQPEFDIATGLPSNSVRCLKMDKSSRLWIGTDNGLSIINSNEAANKKIVDAMNQKSIRALAFLDSLVFVGSRYNGLFVFNQFTGNLLKSYPANAINQIRKIKVLENSVYILTNEGAYKWGKNALTKLTLEDDGSKDFLLEIFQWNNKIYGFTNLYRQMVLTDKNVFALYKKYSYKAGCFSALSVNNALYVGRAGNTNTIAVDKQNNATKYFNFPKEIDYTFVVWDMAYYNEKFILAFGDTRTNETGALCILDSNFNAREIKVTDYVSCLEVDTATNTLYYGTLNKGVYMQKGLASSQMFNKPLNTGIIANDKYIFNYNSTSFHKVDAMIVANSFKKNIGVGSITSLSIEGDTLVSVTKQNVNVYRANDLKLIQTFRYDNPLGNVLHNCRINNTIFTFENYGNVKRYDLANPYSTLKNYVSFLPYPLKFGNRIFCLNKEKGFSVIENETYYQLECTDSSIAFANDFTVIKDRLYTLSNSELKVFKIDYNSNELLLKSTTKVTYQIEGFVPKWILSHKGNLYMLNDKGIVSFNIETITPTQYFYYGNYNQINKPIIAGDSLLVVSNSYLTKFSFCDIEKQAYHLENTDWNISIPESINENLGFQVSIYSPNYLLQSHSLKQLEVWQNGKLVKTLYTVTEQFPFTDGLKYGDYEFRISIGKIVKTKKLSITLPLNRNPYFFGAILFLVLVIAFILFKTMLDKRKTKKQLLQNRLEILKQNLNPHFIYNSMNLISSLILEGKNDEAVQVVADFSSLQRSYLETNNKPFISLNEELNFLNAYLVLQQKRFLYDNEFINVVNIDKDINIDSILVPPLILQPIAENAIKYGIVGSDATNKKITIDIKGINPTIISIEDNGNYAAQNGGLGMGQRLVKERLEIFTKTNHKNITVSFAEQAKYSNKGYRVEIIVY